MTGPLTDASGIRDQGSTLTRRQALAWGAGGTLALLIVVAVLSIGGAWVWHRYTEFTVMRAVVSELLCSNPKVAAERFNVVCPAPPQSQPGQGAVPSGNTSPGAPAGARPPG